MSMSDAQVYESVKDDLVRYATALVGPDLASDVVSTVVLRVLSRRSLTDLAAPRPYLFRGVLNESRSVLRRNRRDLVAVPIDWSSDVPNLEPEVIEAVFRLPVQQRAATYLVYWMGCTVSEAARLMSVRPGTVKRYLSLARDHLKEVLDAHHV